MLKKRIFCCAVLAIAINSSFAGTMGEIKSCPDLSCFPWFLELGSGISWSTTSDIYPATSHWDPALEGYNSTLGTTPLYTAGIGYTINPLISVDVSYTFRGIYNYQKHQTALNATAVNPLGNKTRYFDLTSNSIMVGGTLYGQGLSDKLAYSIGNYGIIQPIIGGGLGVSYNTVSNFHSVLDTNALISSIMLDHTKASFAWQANAGLEWKKNRFSFDVGYRYFNAGTFLSNNAVFSIVNNLGGAAPTNLAPAWSSKLAANELYFTAKVAF